MLKENVRENNVDGNEKKTAKHFFIYTNKEKLV